MPYKQSMPHNKAQLFLAFVSLMFLFLASAKTVSAAPLTNSMVRLDRMSTSTATTGTVCANPATTATENDVQITFPTGFTVSETLGDWTVTTTNLPEFNGTVATAWPSIAQATAADNTTKVVTFPSGDLTPGTIYCFNWDDSAALTTQGGAASDISATITTRDSNPTNIDSTDFAIAVISDDQVVLTATVPPTFSFTLGENTETFTTDLSSSSVVSTDGVTVTIGTNAANGWLAWIVSANQGLDSSTTSETIDTGGSIDDACTTLTTGSDFYQLDVDLTQDSGTGDGTVDIDDEYDCAATTGGTLPSAFEEIAEGDGTTAGDILTLIARATITAVKAAADDYTDTWTIVGAGNF